MKELINELDAALAILSTLSVSGDAVDMMAAAKTKLRRAKRELEKKSKEEVTPDG